MNGYIFLVVTLSRTVLSKFNFKFNLHKLQLRDKFFRFFVYAFLVKFAYCVGMVAAIPRMNIIPSDKKMPFQLNMRQFPISICFAMTINKSQGQTLSKVGLFLERPVFSHGQLYVVVSRVKSKKGLKVLCCDSDGNHCNHTTNVVYKEVLNHL